MSLFPISIIVTSIFVFFLTLKSYFSFSHYFLPSVQGNAGCLLKHSGLLLAVRTLNSNKWDIPSGKPQGNETADQTAVRETLEETGVQVEAIKLLETFKDKFYVYQCRPLENISIDKLLVIPHSSKDEIKEAAFINIYSLTPCNTRFPSVLKRIYELFNDLP